LRKLKPHFPAMRPPWTDTSPLPGGDMPDADFGRFLAGLRARRPWLPESLARRYARAYGTRTDRLVGDAASLAGLGQHLGEGLYAREVEYLVDQEWTRTADDVLWRRSKLGLHISPATQAALKAWFGESPASAMVVQQ
jgi:glycerol-3-phosphate dehydrogenase